MPNKISKADTQWPKFEEDNDDVPDVMALVGQPLRTRDKPTMFSFHNPAGVYYDLGDQNCVELDSDSPHQSDIDLLDSNEIKELRNDDQWNEVLNMQVSSQDETVVEPLIGEETRELLSYNQLLEQARAITDLEKTTDRHCVLKTYYESTDSEYESVHSGEQQSRSESELVPQSLVTLETEEESSKNSVPIKIVRAEIHTQGDQIPLDCPKSNPSTTTITCPAVTHSQSSMNTQIPQSQLASTPCNYLPYQGLQSRKVSFTPASIVDQSNKIMQNKPSEETNQDMPIKIYVKELSRLMESGMDYEDASKAADCIVQHVLTNTKRCINSSQKTKPNGQPVFRTSSQPSYLTSTPLHTQPLALSGQSVKIPSMYNKQSNNGATPKYSVTSSIPKMNPLVMCPSKVNKTRCKQSVEFHNMQREPEENMRRYANRIRKAFHLAYPIKSTIDKATAFSREQIMMDRFLEGLSFDVQTRLNYKEFAIFEKLIEKAEMTAMAVEEAQVRSRLNAFQAKYVEPNREFTKVKEALDRLSSQVESNTHQKHLEENMEKMQRQLSTRRNGKLKTTDVSVGPLGGTKKKPRHHINSLAVKSTVPRIRIKIGNSVVKALFDTGAERSVISSTFFHKLKEGKELINFTKEVDVDLFSINDRRLVTEGTITVNFFVAEETPRQALRQKFIIVNGIVEDCVLGRDALWKHQFIYNGKQQSIYQVPEIDHFQETENPFVISKSLRIPPISTSLLETREEETHPFNPLNTCHFVRCCNILSGLSLEPYISTTPNRSLRVVAVNGTDKTIFLPRLTVLGTLHISRPSRKPVETMASISVASDPINTAAVESALPDIDEENKENLLLLLEQVS
ncbi:hypothetical protein OUZ56_017433 [Daphnia magna]|uniref:Peptidase A2 domain-containing protein n=1 Tax=Daphnia magna TaxID=35525 RepID=A0ABR0ASS4_9CRUS|nr:hypothetical protein OUZ56_017433 [Daphnia magna]